MAEVIVAAIAAGIAGFTAVCNANPAVWVELMKRIKSSKDEKEIFTSLCIAVGFLVCQKNDHGNKVESHCWQTPSDTYGQWVKMVQEVEEQGKKLTLKREEKGKISRKEMQKLGKRVGELKEAGDQLEGNLFVDPKPEPVVRKSETPDIQKFGTLSKPLENILVLLKNDAVYKIGIHGPLGIGKTTIMENLNNHEEVSRLFDIVIWVKASTEGSKVNFNPETILEVLHRRLQLDLERNTDPEEIKRAISVTLRRKKYLLLLDDVKELPNLEEMGIPHSKNGSKVVLTTRLKHVCSEAVDRMIKVNYLSRDEAWKMFKDVIKQPKLMNDSIIGSLAWRICKECGGHPLLVEKVASTFRLMNSEQDWSEGLKSWRMWPEKERQGIEELYNMFKFCYDALEDDNQKRCFLYGALYPEDSEIYSDYLLECWAADDILSKHSDKTRFSQLVLKRLKNVSLLEQGKTENHVIMHKFIRQVALYILEKDSQSKYLVETNGTLREPPDVQLWLEKNRISLGDNKLCTLPDSPNCGELYTLFLQKNLGLGEIPILFFEYMENLRVLDLSDTGIMSLPPSLLHLIKLKILYLNNCKHLKSLPTDITKLEHLEALDVRGSGIVNIPDHIGDLINLRRLRVSFAKSGNANAAQGNHFNHNIISKLSALEELAIDLKTPDQWSKEVVGNIMNSVAPLTNFKTLKFFFPDKVVDSIQDAPMILRIRVPESTTLLSFLEKSRWKNVQNIKPFHFYISVQTEEQPELVNLVKYEKYVKYCNGEGSNFPTGVLSVADAFELVNHKDIKQLSDIDIASMNNFQACLIEGCDAFVTVVNAAKEIVLPNLEHLYLKNLPKLRSICEGSLTRGSLTNIKTLVLISCHLLTKIFPSAVIEQLCQIEHLTVEDCPEVKKLFPSVRSSDVLPKLTKLKLFGIQKLTKICETNALNWPSLEKLKVSDCPQLKRLPFNKMNAKKMRAVKAEQVWWDSVQWQNEETKEQIKKLCILSP